MAKRIKWQDKTRLREVNGSQLPEADLKPLLASGEAKKIMKAFMAILQERFQRSILHHDIGHEGDLSDGMRNRVFSSPSHVQGRETFLYYGRFVDMGVGKGVTLSEQTRGVAATSSRVGKRARRVKKPWYSNTLGGQRRRLPEIFAQAQAGELAGRTAAQLRSKINRTL